MLNKLRSNKGFTLIELLIVVAIIGILAAVAIPQFAAYRTRGFNAAANSDVRNVGTAQEALFADTQGYGSIVAAVLAPAVATAGPSVVVVGPKNGATTVAASTGTQVQNVSGSVPFSLSNSVGISNTTTVTAAPAVVGLGLTYVVVSKHTKGDACFGRDSDSTGMYRASNVTDSALATTDVPGSVTATIELAGDTGTCKGWTIQ